MYLFIIWYGSAADPSQLISSDLNPSTPNGIQLHSWTRNNGWIRIRHRFHFPSVFSGVVTGYSRSTPQSRGLPRKKENKKKREMLCFADSVSLVRLCSYSNWAPLCAGTVDLPLRSFSKFRDLVKLREFGEEGAGSNRESRVLWGLAASGSAGSGLIWIYYGKVGQELLSVVVSGFSFSLFWKFAKVMVGIVSAWNWYCLRGIPAPFGISIAELVFLWRLFSG